MWDACERDCLVVVIGMDGMDRSFSFSDVKIPKQKFSDSFLHFNYDPRNVKLVASRISWLSWPAMAAEAQLDIPQHR